MKQMRLSRLVIRIRPTNLLSTGRFISCVKPLLIYSLNEIPQVIWISVITNFNQLKINPTRLSQLEAYLRTDFFAKNIQLKSSSSARTYPLSGRATRAGSRPLKKVCLAFCSAIQEVSRKCVSQNRLTEMW